MNTDFCGVKRVCSGTMASLEICAVLNRLAQWLYGLCKVWLWTLSTRRSPYSCMFFPVDGAASAGDEANDEGRQVSRGQFVGDKVRETHQCRGHCGIPDDLWGCDVSGVCGQSYMYLGRQTSTPPHWKGYAMMRERDAVKYTKMKAAILWYYQPGNVSSMLPDAEERGEA